MALAAFAVILLLAVTALPAIGIAADTRTGSDVSIGQGERLTNDVYVAAGSFDFDGQAQRDVSVMAGEASLGGTIGGSVHVLSGNTTISGRVDGSVHIASGRVRVTGQVVGDVVLLGGELTVTSSGTIGGNLVVAGGRIDLRGTIRGDLSGWTGMATLGGTNLGSVDLTTSGLSILDSARIDGHVTYSSRSGADVDDGAQIARGITRERVDPWGSGDHPLGRASGSLLRLLWALIAGALLVLATPRLANHLGQNGRSFVRALIFGVIGLIVIPLAVILLMTSFVGLPAGVILLLVFLVSLYLTQVVAGISIGRFILPERWNDGSRGFHLLAMTLGVLLIGATRFIPLPYVHGLIMLFVTIWGIGATVMLFVPNRDRPEASAA